METKKLKICFLGEAKKEDIFALRWAKYFADKGHNVHFISYSKPEEKISNIKFYLIKKKFSNFGSRFFNAIFNLPFIVRETKKMVKEINPDIAHAQCVTSYGSLGFLLKIRPFVITAYGSDILINPKESFLTKMITRYVLSKADLITCDAEHMKEAIKNLGINSDKIKIISFGLDTEKFKPGGKNSGILQELGFSENDKIIISLRNLEPIYDLETLIQAIPAVLREFSLAKFIIAGKGSQEEKLKKKAKDLKISESVKFIGFVLNNELPKYLSAADIYVSTSLSDGGLASSTAEAMSCGLPVVITNSGENEKWIQDGKNGFIVPVKSPDKLAEKIVFLLKNEEKRKEFGLLSRQTIKEKNNYFVEMAKMGKVYFDLLNNF